MSNPLTGFIADSLWTTCPHHIHYLKGTKPKCRICREQQERFEDIFESAEGFEKE
jgi:hypothetical protein